jgi:hypothetical protein
MACGHLPSRQRFADREDGFRNTHRCITPRSLNDRCLFEKKAARGGDINEAVIALRLAAKADAVLPQ